MKKQITIFECDGCGKILKNEDGVACINRIEKPAKGWVIGAGKIYCPKCWDKMRDALNSLPKLDL